MNCKECKDIAICGCPTCRHFPGCLVRRTHAVECSPAYVDAMLVCPGHEDAPEKEGE